jgi:NTP pyrophosphatase (non-canonical NTP hydrolase)
MKNDLARSVKRFHKEFDLQRRNQSENLWICLMLEEMGELTRAVLRRQSKTEVENELGDIVYVMEGFCQLFGYELWAGVERAICKNDSKRRKRFNPASGGKVLRNPATPIRKKTTAR